ncbi:MAG: CDP-alcohol phosphatidyltransferase family protein [Thermofilum sp.]
MKVKAYILAGPEALSSHYGTPVLLRWLLLVKGSVSEVLVVPQRGARRGVEELLSALSDSSVRVADSLEDVPAEPHIAVLIDASYLVAPDAVQRILENESDVAGTHSRRVIIARVAVDGRSALRVSDLNALGSFAAPVELDELVERRHRPACVPAASREAERALLRWAQKGVHFTSMLNAPLENLIVSLVGRSRYVTPNRITALVNLLAIPAILLFLYGRFLEASIFSYLIGILDGVDGKLARVRGVLTKLGHLEHSLDALYEQALYASFIAGLALHGWSTVALQMGLALLVVDCFVRHIYNQFTLVTGAPLKRYAEFDRLFAKVDGRRNVYLLYFTAFSALQTPHLALAAALSHSALTAIVYAVRAYQHLSELDRRSGVKRASTLLFRSFTSH